MASEHLQHGSGGLGIEFLIVLILIYLNVNPLHLVHILLDILVLDFTTLCFAFLLFS